VEIHISVRMLVEFLMRSGDIDNRHGTSAENAMAEGSRIHRMIQNRMGGDYRAEVPLSFTYETPRFPILIEGRADGIIEQEDGYTIDEIKGTYADIHKMKEAVPVHVAQARCYAFMNCTDPGQKIGVRLTYCNMDTEEVRFFAFEENYEDLRDWFMSLMEDYRQWADLTYDRRNARQASIHLLEFPFAYRKGQKELASHVYSTIVHKKKLFLEAPTGVGKTISTVFPAIKAIGEEKADRLFYLTAKTVTGTVAEEAFSILRGSGLSFHTVSLTAKEKVCAIENMDCNPVACPYAKGHFDRINEALFEILTQEDHYEREIIRTYAEKFMVCPFELALDISLFCDGIICDYNYLFDPHVYLKRFFAEGKKGEYLFLVDEAHNLLERGRDMYSAALYKEDFLALKNLMKEESTRISKNAESVNKQMLALKRECEDYLVLDSIDALLRSLMRLHSSMSDFLEDRDRKVDPALRKELLNAYFTVSHFLQMYELVDEHYVIYDEMQEDGRFMLKLFCTDPSLNLRSCMDRGVSTILFSATLLPIQYYKGLLGGEAEDYEVYAESTFDPSRCLHLIADDVTTKYTARGAKSYEAIASYIHTITRQKTGHYMIFFPSYRFMQDVYDRYEAMFFDPAFEECILQETNMNEEGREAFLERFRVSDETKEKNLLGFCVMGGIFSEGIDLKNDSLIGTIIVGAGIPQVCNERKILMDHFDANGGDGFDYAYRFVGVNKVLQAAGRVIRTAEDTGVVAILDYRVRDWIRRGLLPREWSDNLEITSAKRVEGAVTAFWQRMERS